QSLVTHVDGPLDSTIWKLFYWSLRRHRDENQTAPAPSGGVAERAVRGAPSARAKRGARGELIKVSGRLITAILFGSAARRCSWENRIFCYQMTVRIEALCAERLLFRGQSQRLLLRRPRN